MNEQLTVGSLFSGIGGFDIGLERAGMRVIWQSEIDPYASAVLRRHWPAVPNLGDVRGITAATVADAFHDGSHHPAGDAAESRCNRARNGIPVGNDWRPSVLCGGFPCQDISNAGKRAGIDGERSGLWSEFARLIGELRPRYAIMENVAALLGRGLERVLGDLATLGYDAEWHCIPASAVGAPHRRDRVWIVAYPRRAERWPQLASGNITDGHRSEREEEASRTAQRGQALADDTDDGGRSMRGFSQALSDSLFIGGNGKRRNTWEPEPDVGRVAHGIPRRVDRLRCLGNAIVPQIAEIIGRAIVSAHACV